MNAIAINETNMNTLFPDVETPDNWEELSESLPTTQKRKNSCETTMEVVFEVKEVLLPVRQNSPTNSQKKTVTTVTAGNTEGRKTMTLADYRAASERKNQQLLAQQEAAAKEAELAALPANTRRNKHKKELAKLRKAAAIAATTEGESKSNWETSVKVPKMKKIRKPDTIRDHPANLTASTTLILKNLPSNCSASELGKFFKKCGSVKFVNMLKDQEGKCKGIAFVRFETKEGSNKGLTMDGFWYENQKVYVEYAKERTN